MKYKLLVALALYVTIATSQVFAAAGTLDPTFGSAGIVTPVSGFSFSDVALAPESVKDVAAE